MYIIFSSLHSEKKKLHPFQPVCVCIIPFHGACTEKYITTLDIECFASGTRYLECVNDKRFGPSPKGIVAPNTCHTKPFRMTLDSCLVEFCNRCQKWKERRRRRQRKINAWNHAYVLICFLFFFLPSMTCTTFFARFDTIVTSIPVENWIYENGNIEFWFQKRRIFKIYEIIKVNLEALEKVLASNDFFYMCVRV